MNFCIWCTPNTSALIVSRFSCKITLYHYFGWKLFLLGWKKTLCNRRILKEIFYKITIKLDMLYCTNFELFIFSKKKKNDLSCLEVTYL